MAVHDILRLYFWVIAETGNVSNLWLSHLPTLIRPIVALAGHIYQYLDASTDI